MINKRCKPGPKPKDYTNLKYNMLTFIKLEYIKGGIQVWRLQCECGKEITRRSSSVFNRNIKSCGCHKRGKNVKILTGLIFGKLKVLDKYKIIKTKSSSRTAWLCQCECGNQKYISSGNLQNGDIKSCGCSTHLKGKDSHHWTGYGDISGELWYTIKSQAEKRNIKFELSIKYAWQQFIKQNRKCALSGIDLQFPIGNDFKSGNASLDRIDSKKGYIEENIQWTTKDINLMKRTKSNQEFIDLCKLVAFL